MDEAIQIGKYAVPWILSILLAFVFSQITFPDKTKNLIAVLAGIGLGLLAIFIVAEPWTRMNIFEHILLGFNYGLTAVGFWKTVNIQVRDGGGK